MVCEYNRRSGAPACSSARPIAAGAGRCRSGAAGSLAGAKHCAAGDISRLSRSERVKRAVWAGMPGRSNAMPGAPSRASGGGLIWLLAWNTGHRARILIAGRNALGAGAVLLSLKPDEHGTRVAPVMVSGRWRFMRVNQSPRRDLAGPRVCRPVAASGGGACTTLDRQRGRNIAVVRNMAPLFSCPVSRALLSSSVKRLAPRWSDPPLSGARSRLWWSPAYGLPRWLAQVFPGPLRFVYPAPGCSASRSFLLAQWPFFQLRPAWENLL